MRTLKPFTPPKNPFFRAVYLLVRRFVRHNVGAQSAALAFYLLFMLFPFLIFISALLGLLHLDVAYILSALTDFLPVEVVDIARVYLTYVSDNPSPQLMVFGLVFSVYFPMRAANSLMSAVRTAYHLGPAHGPVQLVKTFIYTLLLIATIVLTLVLMSVSDRILAYCVANLRLPPFIAYLWTLLRFPVAAVVGYFALFTLYALAQDGRQPWKNIWPGALGALAGWLVLSWLYAWYVEHMAHYSLLYGSIGTVIVLMIWLNMTAMVLIMGAEVNGTVMSLRKGRP